jgi:hypothetical protein
VDADTTAPWKSLLFRRGEVAEAPPSEGLTVEASLSVPTTTTTSSMLLNRYFYREKEMKHLRKPKAEKPAGAFGALFSLRCVRYITRGSLFIGGPWA